MTSASLSDLSGRTVLVTGASSGLGKELALACAKAGARVVVAARRLDRLSQVVDEIKSLGREALAVRMDVCEEASVIAAFDEAQAAFGPIDSVIANAGINTHGRALDIGMDQFDEVMSVNTRGVFMTAREGARRMIAAGSRESRRGRIVLVASIGGLKVVPSVTAYCTSKAATVMMGRSLAREWAAAGINVNVLCPGYVETEINQGWFEQDAGKKLIASFPRRRLMQASELAPTTTFLLSDGAGAITGAVLTADDGQSL